MKLTPIYFSLMFCSVFLSEFASAWTKLANADRFSGPAISVCT